MFDFLNRYWTIQRAIQVFPIDSEFVETLEEIDTFHDC